MIEQWIADLREKLADVLTASHGATDTGRGLEFPCPRPQHDDSSPSAFLRDYAWGCMGCGHRGGLKDLAKILSVEVPKGNYGYTVEDYAAEKDFKLEKLTKYGLSTVQHTSKKTGNTLNVVAIPYYDEEGEFLRNRLRGGTSKWWEVTNSGSQEIPGLYGLWMLAKVPDAPVILVEGESDCHAAWHHSALAIGVPGASAWRKEYERHLAGRKVYLWQEPGQGGKTFRKSVAQSYPKAGAIRAPEGVKDLSVLHLIEGDNFSAALEALMQVADPADAPEPPVKIHVVGEAFLDDLIQHQERPIDAIPTPFPSLNDKCLNAGGGIGLAKGWNIIVGAATGGYKSTIVANFAAHGVRIGKRVGWLGLEEDKYENSLKFLPALTGVEARKLYQGRWYDRSVAEKAKAIYMEHFYRTGGTLILPDKPVKGLDNVMDAYYYMVEVMGAEIILLDYLQLAGDVASSESTLRKVAEISDRVRLAAEALNVVNVSASQFKRDGQQDRPHRGMLMGGSPLENDSDMVLLPDHTSREYATIGDEKGQRRVTYLKLIVDKNRHGPDGFDQDISLMFDPYNRRMLETAPPEPTEEVPQ